VLNHRQPIGCGAVQFVTPLGSHVQLLDERGFCFNKSSARPSAPSAARTAQHLAVHADRLTNHFVFPEMLDHALPARLSHPLSQFC